MNKFGTCILAMAVLCVALVPAARACYDNSDSIVQQLMKCELDKEQLAEIFRLKAGLKETIAHCHKEGEGCHVHELAEKDFHASAVGLLNDDQFEEYKGRERTEVESLQYENFILRKKIEKMEKELELLRKLLEENNATK